METPTLQYFETAQVASIPGKSITVRVANGRVLGRFRGLIIDPINQQLRYVVIRASGWFGKTTLVPAYSPRIDLAGRAIEIDANDNDLWTVHNFTLQKALRFGVCARAT
ncbi:MAG TPA: PRC-barrel domain-containing protein [Vicinamibacterales bacterium]|nr:PRC-barrel domain-containing protein [Vicinamibacterales bacterium]